MVGKKHSGKADQPTLASGGIEYVQLFSVAIYKLGHWGNKMGFSLCRVFAQTEAQTVTNCQQFTYTSYYAAQYLLNGNLSHLQQAHENPNTAAEHDIALRMSLHELFPYMVYMGYDYIIIQITSSGRDHLYLIQQSRKTYYGRFINVIIQPVIVYN